MKNEKNKPNLFSNNFGTITSDEIHIHSFDIKIPLLFKYIKKVQLAKKRRLHLNYFLLLLSVFMFWMMLHNNIFFVSNTILGTSGIALLAAGVFYRTSERQFIIFTRFDFIKIEVEASLEEDSKKFIKEFNKYHD
jgi:hypothetical protein